MTTTHQGGLKDPLSISGLLTTGSPCWKVCDAAGVVLKVVPFTEEYWEEVVGDSVMSIRKGLTPNPDILCNSRIKFGAFHEFLEKAHAGEFDRIVSGHYARVDRPEYRKTNTGTASASPTGNKVLLAITPDEVKDQTYFLAQLSQAQVSKPAPQPCTPCTQRWRAHAMLAL